MIWNNHCSLWFDGMPCCERVWEDCCRKHDEPTPWYQWLADDIMLARCVHASSYSAKFNGHPVRRHITRWVMPAAMFTAVSTVGYIFRPLNSLFNFDNGGK